MNEYRTDTFCEFELETAGEHIDGMALPNGVALLRQKGLTEKVCLYDKKVDLTKPIKDYYEEALFPTKELICENKARRLFVGDGYVAVTFGRFICLWNGSLSGRYIVTNRWGTRKIKIPQREISESAVEKMEEYCKEVTGLSLQGAIEDDFTSDAYDVKSEISLR